MEAVVLVQAGGCLHVWGMGWLVSLCRDHMLTGVYQGCSTKQHTALQGLHAQLTNGYWSESS